MIIKTNITLPTLDKNNNGHYSAYNDGINLSQKFERHNPQNIGS